MKALVTGAAGFLGSFLSEELLKNGYQVIGVDNFFRGKKEYLPENDNFANFGLANSWTYRFLDPDSLNITIYNETVYDACIIVVNSNGSFTTQFHEGSLNLFEFTWHIDSSEAHQIALGNATFLDYTEIEDTWFRYMLFEQYQNKPCWIVAYGTFFRQYDPPYEMKIYIDIETGEVIDLTTDDGF